MAFKRELLEQWIDQRFPGDDVVAYTLAKAVSGTEYGGTFYSVDRLEGDGERDELRSALGLGRETKVTVGESETFLAVTQRRFVVGRRTSFRNRPGDQVIEVPLSDVTVHWFDATTGPNWFRHWVITFADGRWRTDRTGLKALGKPLQAAALSDDLVAALGERAERH